MSAKKNKKPVAVGKKGSPKHKAQRAPRPAETPQPAEVLHEPAETGSEQQPPVDGSPPPAQAAPADASPTRRKRQATQPKAEGALTAIDAAAKVLGEAGASMNTRQMIEAMAQKGYWTSPDGKTPAATLFSAILREINTKGDSSRFVKAERGQFTLKA